LRETINQLKLEKQVKIVILALNIQFNPLKNGADEWVLNILKSCKSKDIPVLHCSSRAKMGKAFTGKFGSRISVLSVLNYESCETEFREVMETWELLKD
jgi:ribosomal protein L7Ae-like RNA K-turn-binding protein